MSILKAQTRYGTVCGAETDAGFSVFRGVPFAKPPVGGLRFMPPQEPDAWEGELECKEFAPACIQERRHGEQFATSEDCLYLNVFTPAEAAGEKLPVMLWIYGGGFSGGNGANPEFDGAAINKRGVILVTINYRCGALGFFALKALEERTGGSWNLGLLDQIAALKWVRDNIEAFGGDPERVLVFGQSAGGMSTRMLLCSPAAEGLFSRAVIQSGGGLNEADPVHTKEDFMKICQDAADHLGWTVDDLLTRDADEVNSSLSQAARELSKVMAVGYFQPFIDGVTIVDVPGNRIKSGEYMDIPVICGTVAGDSWMFSRNIREQLEGHEGFFRGFSFSPGESWAKWQSMCGRRPIYTYYMDIKQPKRPGGPGGPGGMGAHGAPPFGVTTPHSSEIAYIFGTLKVKEERQGVKFRPEDFEVSEVMTDFWTNFAKNGDPNGEGLPKWPLNSAATPLAMHFADDGIRAEMIVTGDEERRVLDHTINNPGMISTTEGL